MLTRKDLIGLEATLKSCGLSKKQTRGVIDTALAYLDRAEEADERVTTIETENCNLRTQIKQIKAGLKHLITLAGE
jgi:hypothetical protein